MPKKLVIILPCYNEEEVLPKTIDVIRNLLSSLIEAKRISPESQACFVNDGSKDKTWEIIADICRKNKMFSGLNLARNFGHQGAILAGMYETKADVYVTIDADLQDNPECIGDMLTEIENGCEIVYGVRDERKSDTLFKKYSALIFYKLLKILGVNIVYNHADYRMMTHKAVSVLQQFPERNLFLRAIIPLIGFKSSKVYYNRAPRLAGETKYPLNKMIALAWNGISNFSIVPLRFVTFLGLFICMVSVLFLIYLLYRWSVGGTIVGWASLVTIITVFSGVQLLSLGIIGEYLAKIFVEVKKRPLFIVDEKINIG